ncbi:MAG TPA: lysophospholipid acyltransferase family protein [Phenylobacterium sp.]|nr:lysophospholipid acyltransferase family protein [Phenylobacterium sp.]
MTALRSLIFVALFYVWSAAVAIAVFPLLLFPPLWMLRCLVVWSVGINFLLRICCDIKVEIRGREHIPTAGSALIAAKHQCMLDVFVQFGVLPGALFVAKKELMWIPFFGWYARKMGMVVVDRSGHSTALRKMIRDAQAQFAKAPRQILIFPEGTRTAPGAEPDYKPGIAGLYREFDLPVVPVATNSGVHWPKHGFIRRPGTIVFEYLEPIPPGLKRAEFMRLLQERIEPASERLLVL